LELPEAPGEHCKSSHDCRFCASSAAPISPSYCSAPCELLISVLLYVKLVENIEICVELVIVVKGLQIADCVLVARLRSLSTKGLHWGCRETWSATEKITPARQQERHGSS